MGYVVDRLGLRLPGAVDVMLPEGDATAFVQPGADLDEGRRAEGVQEELFLAAPGHLHRGPCQTGQACGLQRLGGDALAAETASQEGGDDADLPGAQAQGLGQLPPQQEGGLGGGPDCQLALLPLGHRRVRLQGAWAT